MVKDEFLGEKTLKSLARSNALLQRLSKVPCGDLLSIARRVLRGERRIKIPGVRNVVKVRVYRRKSKALSGSFTAFPDNRITLFKGNGTPIATLVHEMRHAQQAALLGWKRFYAVLSITPLLDPLEIDATAAEMVASRARRRAANDPLSISLDTLYRSHAKAIGRKRFSKARRRT